MRIAILTLGIFTLSGCIHDFSNRDQTPTRLSTNETHVTPTSTRSESQLFVTSDYQDCLNRVAGLPDAAQFCHDWIWARRPGQLPAYRYAYGYPYWPY